MVPLSDFEPSMFLLSAGCQQVGICGRNRRREPCFSVSPGERPARTTDLLAMRKQGTFAAGLRGLVTPPYRAPRPPELGSVPRCSARRAAVLNVGRTPHHRSVLRRCLSVTPLSFDLDFTRKNDESADRASRQGPLTQGRRSLVALSYGGIAFSPRPKRMVPTQRHTPMPGSLPAPARRAEHGRGHRWGRRCPRAQRPPPLGRHRLCVTTGCSQRPCRSESGPQAGPSVARLLSARAQPPPPWEAFSSRSRG